MKKYIFNMVKDELKILHSNSSQVRINLNQISTEKIIEHILYVRNVQIEADDT